MVTTNKGNAQEVYIREKKIFFFFKLKFQREKWMIPISIIKWLHLTGRVGEKREGIEWLKRASNTEIQLCCTCHFYPKQMYKISWQNMLHPQSILVSPIQVLGSWSSKKNFYRKYRNASSMSSIKDISIYLIKDED